VLLDLRRRGCRCRPSIRWAEPGSDFAGLVRHEEGCPLGDRCAELNDAGIMPEIALDPLARCRAGEDPLLLRLTPFADQAIAERRPVFVGDEFVVMSDAFIEGLNEERRKLMRAWLSSTPRLQRADGRWAVVFRQPPKGAA
jgi:hypothetical protein